MMMVFCKEVSFPRWLGIFSRESRCQSQRRSSLAPTTHTPCRCPSSSLEKACHWLLPRYALHCETQRNAVAAADLSPSCERTPAFREGQILLSSTRHRGRRSMVCLDQQRIQGP